MAMEGERKQKKSSPISLQQFISTVTPLIDLEKVIFLKKIITIILSLYN